MSQSFDALLEGAGTPRLELVASGDYMEVCAVCTRTDEAEGDLEPVEEWIVVGAYDSPHPLLSDLRICLCESCDTQWSDHFTLPDELFWADEDNTDNIVVSVEDPSFPWWATFQVLVIPTSDGEYEKHVQEVRDKMSAIWAEGAFATDDEGDE
ncbi:hypothetical protein [Rhodococcoides fascians]|uniref:hypothetical protein n=1 Tax=Rhodococcoides fascians TaxID=1828 RepID=UPI00050CE7D9|nr:hypothetical protein [Rhodococcus fascians]